MAGKVCIPLGSNYWEFTYIELANSNNPKRFMYSSFSNHLSRILISCSQMGIYAAFGCSQALFSFFMGSTFALLTFFASQNLHKVILIWHCSFMGVCGLMTAFRMQSSESCTPQCHSLRQLCVCFVLFWVQWKPHAWILASWSYYEPFLERHVYLTSITTALGVDLTNFCFQILTPSITY